MAHRAPRAVTRHGELVEAARRALGAIDVALVAHGVLADSDASERDPALLERLLRTDFVGAPALCQRVASDMAEHGGGVLLAVSSVAGDRARPSNYAYGAAKGGLSMFLGGLDAKMHAGFRNLLQVSAVGAVNWEAQLPTSGDDCYVDAHWVNGDIVAFSWSGYRVVIDALTGDLVSSVFTK